MARNYKEEYKSFHSKPDQKKRRAGRNAARKKLLDSGAVKKGDNKDVHHKDGNALNNKKKNLKVVSKSKNRGSLRVKGKK